MSSIGARFEKEPLFKSPSIASFFLATTGSAFCSDGSEFLRMLQEDCRYAFYSQEVVEALQQERAAWTRYQSIAGSIETEEFLLKESPANGSIQKLKAARASLHQYYYDVVLPLAKIGRAAPSVTPFMGELTAENAPTISIQIDKKMKAGRL